MDRLVSLDGRGALKQSPRRTQLKQDDAERKDIGAPIDFLAGTLLGAHVGKLALDHTRLRPRLAAFGLGDAEVHDLDEAFVGQQQVLRRYVAMDDAQLVAIGQLGFMRVVKARTGLKQDAAGDVLRNFSEPLSRQLANLGDRQTGYVLHRDEVLAIDLA